MRTLPERLQPGIKLFVLLIAFVAMGSFSFQPDHTYAQEMQNCTVTGDQIEGLAGVPKRRKEFSAAGIASSGEALAQTGGGNNRVAIIIVDDFTTRLGEDELTHGEVVEQVFWQMLDRDEDGLLDNPSIDLLRINIATTALDFDSNGVALQVSEMIDILSDTYSRFVVNMSFAIIACDAEVREIINGLRDQSLESSALSGLALKQEGGEAQSGSLIAELGEDVVIPLLDHPYNVGEPELEDSLVESAASLLAENLSNVEVIQAIASEFDVDALRLVGLVHNLSCSGCVTSIASAGNYREYFERQATAPLPVYPARWPQYIAVSATDDVDSETLLADTSGPSPMFYSNDGEISAYGGPFTLQSPSGAPDENQGTSLSAPIIGAAIAEMLTTGITCDSHPVDDWEVFDNAGTINCTPTP